MKRVWIFILAAILICSIAIVLKFYQQNKHSDLSVISKKEAILSKEHNQAADETSQADVKVETIPAYVLKTLNYIRANNKAPSGYVGGRSYFNRNKVLPQFDYNQIKIQYREWDVHPKRAGQNRGAERLVTGSDQSAYFTKDHYNHFIKINL